MLKVKTMKGTNTKMPKGISDVFKDSDWFCAAHAVQAFEILPKTIIKNI